MNKGITRTPSTINENGRVVKQLPKQKSTAYIKRLIKKYADSQDVKIGDLGYFSTFADLIADHPTGEEGQFATVGQEPAGPSVFYNRDVVSGSWVYNGPTGSYIGLNDTDDTDYVGRQGSVPVVNDTEDGLVFKDGTLPPVVELSVTANGQTSFTLPTPITDVSRSLLFINGQKTKYGTQYTFTDATTLERLNVGFELETSDVVELYKV